MTVLLQVWMRALIRSTELAWAVYSLAMAWADMNVSPRKLLARNRKNEVKKRLDEGLQLYAPNAIEQRAVSMRWYSQRQRPTA